MRFKLILDTIIEKTEKTQRSWFAALLANALKFQDYKKSNYLGALQPMLFRDNLCPNLIFVLLKRISNYGYYYLHFY